MTTPILSAVDVIRHYRRGSEIVRAVDGVTLHLHPASVYVLQGPSGSGKTTLLNLLAGWETPGEGTIEWRGAVTDPLGLGWPEMAVVPQRVALLPELTAGENVTLADRIRGVASTEVPALFWSLGLGDLEDAFPDELSAGQQQRVALARAFAARPAAVLVDEPTSSQDEEHAHLVLGAFARLAAEGAMCLIASHDPVVAEYADHLIGMRDGRLDEPH